MLIVAQRISTVMDADQIVVLEEGTIAGIGTHRELLNTCKVYREIVASQLSEQKTLGELNGHVEEMYTGHKVVKAFGQERASIARFKEINARLYGAAWRAQFYLRHHHAADDSGK